MQDSPGHSVVVVKTARLCWASWLPKALGSLKKVIMVLTWVGIE